MTDLVITLLVPSIGIVGVGGIYVQGWWQGRR